MPPKVKVTKEEIINTAVDIVRNSGAQAVNARTVASALNCSTQPVFSNFATMEELRLAVIESIRSNVCDVIRKRYALEACTSLKCTFSNRSYTIRYFY